MEKDDFDLIDEYISGNLEGDSQKVFFERLHADDAFYRDFQLWTKLDDWLEELPAFEIGQVLSNGNRYEERKFSQKQSFFQLAVACLVTFMVGAWGFWNENYRGVDSHPGKMLYAEINAELNGGSGFGKGATNQVHFKERKFEVQRFEQPDTTYIFVYEPFKLVFRMPLVKRNVAEDMRVILDYKTLKYQMSIGNKKYNFEETNQWKKLVQISK